MFRKNGSELRSVGSEDDGERSTEFVSWSRWGLVASILAHLGSKKTSSLNRARIVGWQTIGSRTGSWWIRCRTSTRGSLICPSIILLFVSVWRIRSWWPTDGSTTSWTRFFIKFVRFITRSVVLWNYWLLIHVELGLFKVCFRRVKVAAIKIRLRAGVQVLRVRVHAHRECTRWHISCSILVRLHWVLHCIHGTHDLKQQ